ncbi:sulfurtransferase TusA family protein [Thalassotalea mangrovi]|uniref:Sulfurtransferase TusA family protein n=1 Tax=Thalassotalea mangrovi TaxID=2572245 RepID=A0A4U1B378_9GAMM|nr:sulfurtransferase TusA family protein [Thalassotalea mangrovi]TKB44364.1 sulfurtransferase TusA family protein [Thalassotalea mangrovi]
MTPAMVALNINSMLIILAFQGNDKFEVRLIIALELDARQWKCPQPLIEMKLALRRLTQGQRLRLLITDPGSQRDIPLWLQRQGFEFEMKPHSHEVMEIIILKREIDV